MDGTGERHLFILVTNLDRISVSYELSVSETVALPQATILTVGNTHSDSLDAVTASGFDSDYFSFDAVAGTEYFIETSVGTLPATSIGLVDQDQFTIIDADSNSGENGSQIVWEAPTSGTYFILVTNFDGLGGTYEIAVTESAGLLLPGDANNDGRVDARDLTILGQNWQLDTDRGIVAGDFNEDGRVDASDLTILGRHWQMTEDDIRGSRALETDAVFAVLDDDEDQNGQL